MIPSKHEDFERYYLAQTNDDAELELVVFGSAYYGDLSSARTAALECIDFHDRVDFIVNVGPHGQTLYHPKSGRRIAGDKRKVEPPANHPIHPDTGSW